MNKNHGRIECREVWLVDSQEMEAYLDHDFGWRAVRLSGRIRRSRRWPGSTQWEQQETYTWVSSLPLKSTSAPQISRHLRQHWTIENGVFWVRDVTYAEDRLQGRKIGPCLSIFRNVAINIIRNQDYPFIPDGWRDIASMSDHGLHLLL